MQAWSIVTKGAWKFPSCSKAETGQWQRSNVGNASLLPTATDDQMRKGIMSFRFSLSKPSAVLTSAKFVAGSSNRALQCEVTTTTGQTYSMNIQFGSSTGGKFAPINTGNLAFDTEYEIFYQVDTTVGTTNNCGMSIYNLTDNSWFRTWTLATETSTTARIGWNYTQANNAVNLFNACPLSKFSFFALWPGESLKDADGNLIGPGLLSPETLGNSGIGLTGTKPVIFLLGETNPTNRGSGPNAWSTTATLLDVGGYSWDHPGGVGPMLALAFDPPPDLNVGETATVTVRAFGANQAMAVTPSVGPGLALIGGPTFNIAENARTASFQVKAIDRGNKTISLANSVGYNNPDAASLPVGIAAAVLLEPDPVAGYAGADHLVVLRFVPA